MGGHGCAFSARSGAATLKWAANGRQDGHRAKEQETMHVISEMRLTVVGAALVIGLAAAVGDASAPAAEPSAPRLLPFLKQRQAVRYQRVPREVLAFYYTWYGRPERQGRWVHWGSVDPDAHDISQSTHYPALGAYDSHDRQVIDRHIAQAKQHGLTGFIATWWGRGTYDDRAFATLLERAAAQDFKVTVYWETAPGKDAAQVAQAIDDLSYVLQRYAESEAFLKVDGKPVLFVYGRVMDQMPLGAWPAIFEGVRQRYGRDFALIADGYSEAYARLFDGVHTYNICGWVRDQSPDALRRASAASFSSAVQLARSQGKISCLTIIPGYDDTKIRKPGLKAERQNGETYRVLWDEATRADPDWILITSWNEWHEGSEIEPSWEDGEKYLQLTKPFAERFRATPHSLASSSAQPAGPSPAQARALSELYRGRPIGVLPEYGHAVVFWLAEAGVPLQELTWQDVLDPRALDPARLPMLLYAGGEHYVRTVRRDGDAEAALRAYLAGGGLLMAFSHQPYPFFYNESGRADIAAGRLGLPILGSGPPQGKEMPDRNLVRAWETPPAEAGLTFQIDNQRLAGLPATVAFPADGDQRWRPATPALTAPTDVYLPLARLTDAEGNVYGDGIAYVEHRESAPKGGRNLYVWMRMLDVLDTNETLYAIFRFLASNR